MVDIYVEYEGDLHCRAEHGPSGAVLATDAPVDNHGLGASFSATDLVATGLGTCILTVIGILAKKRGYRLEGARVHVKKTMTHRAALPNSRSKSRCLRVQRAVSPKPARSSSRSPISARSA